MTKHPPPSVVGIGQRLVVAGRPVPRPRLAGSPGALGRATGALKRPAMLPNSAAGVVRPAERLGFVRSVFFVRKLR